MNSTYYPVDNPSDYWKISLYLAFLSGGRDIRASSQQRGAFIWHLD